MPFPWLRYGLVELVFLLLLLSSGAGVSDSIACHERLWRSGSSGALALRTAHREVDYRRESALHTVLDGRGPAKHATVSSSDEGLPHPPIGVTNTGLVASSPPPPLPHLACAAPPTGPPLA